MRVVMLEDAELKPAELLASPYQIQDVPVPEPGEGEVLVRMAHAGINVMDVGTRKGMFANSQTYPVHLPTTIGMEGAGLVERVGAGGIGVAPGDGVAYNHARRLKTLRGLTTVEFIHQTWTKDPQRFRIDPLHLTRDHTHQSTRYVAMPHPFLRIKPF